MFGTDGRSEKGREAERNYSVLEVRNFLEVKRKAEEGRRNYCNTL